VAAVRLLLVAFVLAWLFGPYALRSTVPVWLAFLIAAGLEVQFFLRGLVAGPPGRPDRGPQVVDRERFGYTDGRDELLLVRDGDVELWVPYAGEEGEELEALIDETRDREEADEEPFAADEELEERGSRWWPASRLLAGLGVIGALALLVWVIEGRTGWDGLDADTRAAATARFSAEASRIAGKEVTIRCDEAGSHVGVVQHADGVAAVGGDLAYLTPGRCFDLYRLAFEGEVISSQTGRALAVLAHEAWHLRGESDEGTTECYALQSAVTLGRRLGLSIGTARQMMRQQLTENLDRGANAGEYLVPADCRDGGALDLDSRSTRFP
jgi:hypothetical protein